MINFKKSVLLFALSILLGTLSANARCPDCPSGGGGAVVQDPPDVVGDGSGTHTAYIKYRVIEQDGNGNNQIVWRFYTVVGASLSACESQLENVIWTINNTGVVGEVIIIHGCQPD